MHDILDTPFMLLSAGQMQHVSIARSLLKKPDLLILDEPTTSLDYENSTKLIRTVRTYLFENQIPAIWCSHNFLEINMICNKFGLLKNNKLNCANDNIHKFQQKAANYKFQTRQQDIKKIKSNIKVTEEVNTTHCYFTCLDTDLYLSDLLNLVVGLDAKILSIEKNYKCLFE